MKNACISRVTLIKHFNLMIANSLLCMPNFANSTSTIIPKVMYTSLNIDHITGVKYAEGLDQLIYLIILQNQHCFS